MIAYFLAGEDPNKIDLDYLNEIGLGYAFEKPPSIGNASKGPNGGPGPVLARDQGYAKIANQNWIPHASVPNCWIGFPPEIDTKTLERDSWRKIPSYNWKDVWKIPVARVWNDKELVSNLPRKLKLCGDDFQPGEVIKQYKRLEEIGIQCASILEDGTLPEKPAMLAAEVIGMLYYLGPQEFAELEIVDSSATQQVLFLECVVDVLNWNKLTKDNKEKKTDSN